MLEALSAEAMKMRRHKATWFLVWLYPIAFTIIFLIAIGAGLAGFESPASRTAEDFAEDSAMIWFVPGNSLGRYLIAAFVAVLFAGEYGWNTWKLIVPHRSRTSLIAAKYAAALLLFAIAFALTAVVTTLLTWLDAFLNASVPEGITVGALLEVHAKAALSALPPILVTIGYASLAAVLTRSTIAALVIAIVATTLEQLVAGFGPMLSVKFPALAPALFHALPGYHLSNLAEWIRDGVAESVPFPGGKVVALGWATSLAVVAAWVAALFGAVFAVFRRQDLN